MAVQVHDARTVAAGAAGDVDATLTQAEVALMPAQRFVIAHTAALQVAAWVLVRRRARVVGRPPVWGVLARVAPELAEWAEFFDALHLKRRAVEAGAEVIMPVEKMFWGDRYGQLRDPFGVIWSMNEPAKR